MTQIPHSTPRKNGSLPCIDDFSKNRFFYFFHSCMSEKMRAAFLMVLIGLSVLDHVTSQRPVKKPVGTAVYSNGTVEVSNSTASPTSSVPVTPTKPPSFSTNSTSFPHNSTSPGGFAITDLTTTSTIA